MGRAGECKGGDKAEDMQKNGRNEKNEEWKETWSEG